MAGQQPCEIAARPPRSEMSVNHDLIGTAMSALAEFGFTVIENVEQDPLRPDFEARIGNFSLEVGGSHVQDEEFRELTSKQTIDLVYKLLGMKAPDSPPPPLENDADSHLLITYRDPEGGIVIPFAHVQLKYPSLEVDPLVLGDTIRAMLREHKGANMTYVINQALANSGVIMPTAAYFDLELPDDLKDIDITQQAELMTYFSISDLMGALQGDVDLSGYNLTSEQLTTFTKLKDGIDMIVNRDGIKKFLLTTIPLVRLSFLMGMLKLFEKTPSTKAFVGNGKENAAIGTLQSLGIPYGQIHTAKMVVPEGTPEAHYFHAHRDEVLPFYILTEEAYPAALATLERAITALHAEKGTKGSDLSLDEISATIRKTMIKNKRA